MPRKYKPRTNLFGLNVAGFEAYFGMAATGPEEPGSGAFLDILGCVERCFS
jgi:hypothetical protein